METPEPGKRSVRKKQRHAPRNRFDLGPFIREPSSYEEERDSQNNKLLYCGQENCLYKSDVNSNFRKHLRTKHQIEVFPEKPFILLAAEKAMKQITASNSLANSSRTIDLTEENLGLAIIHLIVRHSLPLSAIEWPLFHSLLALANPRSADMLMTSRRTLVSDIKIFWAKKKAMIKSDLRMARSYVNIALDIWTSPNNYLFLGIVGHYVRTRDNFGTTTLLGLRHIGGHSGAEQWKVLRTVLEEYEIVEKLGYVIGDNASTNGTLCRTISTSLLEDYSTEWDYEQNQTRCIGHILNLIVQAFLFKKLSEEELDSYDKEDLLPIVDQEAYEERLAMQQMRVREELDCLGKLHNIVIYIKSSSSRTAAFVAQAGKRIPLDNRTRWNSWFSMLERAVQLEKHIDFYLKSNADLKEDCLDTEDWLQLRTIYAFLGKFKEFTKQLESNSSDISQVLPVLLHVRLWIEAHKAVS
jgi:hypothetical protein